MKILNLISSAIVVFGFTMSANAAANYQFVGVDNSIGTSMCLAAVTNDKRALRRKILRSGSNILSTNTKVRMVARTLRCNDLIIANFALKYSALVTFAYLDRFTREEDKIGRTKVIIQDISATQGKTTIVLIASN